MTNKIAAFGGTDWQDGEVLFAQDLIDSIYESTLNSSPIGTIKAFDKSTTGVPILPNGWVECNGQTLSDADSPLDGQTIPDLNGSSGLQRFLRGALTSGTVGGEDQHTLTASELPNYTVLSPGLDWNGGDPNLPNDGSAEYGEREVNFGGGQAHENRPPFYEVVWIMRVK